MKMIKVKTQEHKKLAEEREDASKNGKWSNYFKKKMCLMECKLFSHGEYRKVAKYMRNLQKEVEDINQFELEIEQSSAKENFDKAREQLKYNKYRGYMMQRSKLINELYQGRVVPENLDEIEPVLSSYIEDPDVQEMIEKNKNIENNS